MLKPESSPLLLNDYFVQRLSCEPNPGFDPKKPMDLTLEGISVAADVKEPEAGSGSWPVCLKVFHQISEKFNSPYSFHAEVMGYFSVSAEYSKERAPWLVKTNATSVLYSTTREILRAAMSAGPWHPIILPTVTFYTKDLKAEIAARRQ